MSDMNAYEQAIAHWGKAAQLEKALEELDELKDEIYRDLIEGQVDRKGLLEEMADVHNMLIQLRMIYDISRDEVEVVMDIKMKRTMKRIAEEKEEMEQDEI